MYPKKLPKNAVSYLFALQNHTYTSRRATKSGILMDWDAFSVRLKNRENRKMFRYPKSEKNGFSASKQIYFLLFCDLILDV